MARGRGLTEEDLQVWAAYGRTLTRLMPGRSRLPALPEPAQTSQATPPPPPPAKPSLAKPALALPPPPLAPNTTPAGLDKASWKNFHSGKTRIQAKLDLHGHTAARAHHDVRRFIEQAHSTNLRCIEIITGKGEILARELPHWLNTPSLRPYILAITHPHPTNTGSLRILLRRHRL